jgi:hypothetical protein
MKKNETTKMNILSEDQKTNNKIYHFNNIHKSIVSYLFNSISKHIS